MRWGYSTQEKESERLLYWALTCVLSPYFDDPLDHWLKRILSGARALGGDPGWEMEYVEGNDGKGYYRVADLDCGSLEPCEATYSVEKVREATKETLLALAIEFPERAEEAMDVIRRYQL